MTVYNELNKIAYIGSSEQTLYPIPFEYISTDDIKVSVYTSNNEFVEDWTYSIQYVIEGGNVKVLSGYNIDNTKKLLILRSVDLIQDNKYREGGDFPAKSTETSFDKLTMITQQLQETLDRCVKVEVLNNQTPEELLQTVYDKLDSATEIAGDAISAANQAQTAADNATAAVNSAEQTLVQTQAYVDSAKVEIDNTKNTAINTINSTVTQAKADINTAVSDAESNISSIVSDAEGSITNIAVTEANKAIANAAQEATDMATANVNSYVDGTVKPSLQTYVDQAQEDANSAATSMEQAALSATAASNYADNAAESAGMAANSAAAAATSETNAKASETNAAAAKAEVETIAKLASFGNIGDIKYTSRTDVPNGGAWCDGTLYTKAQFPDVYQMLVDGKLQSTTVTDFDNKVSANGSCGFFGLDTANECFKVPMLKNVYLKAGQAGEMFGAESLPNIKGATSLIAEGNYIYSYGAFYKDSVNKKAGIYGSSSGTDSVNAFDASLSSSTYKDGAKVNPDHVTYRAYIVLYTAKDVSSDMSTEYQLNNPFSLLDYKWSEYALSNASWLLSNGQFNSGATYVSVYELLLKIKNGTVTKDGVSVKLSTEAYTDTDFVINTADTTFRLPIKVKLASGNRVAGNGMTLGLTDGANNAGLVNVSGSGLSSRINAYGSATGTRNSGNSMDTFVSWGITKDPTRSGIETSSSGLKLYFYVGETIQDANVITASQVLAKVANGIDRTVATDRETVVGWGMPDYSARIQISSFPHTVTFKGWLIGQTSQTTENFVYVNDFIVGHAYNNYSQVQVPVDVGDVITKTGSANILICPMKGAN